MGRANGHRLQQLTTSDLSLKERRLSPFHHGPIFRDFCAPTKLQQSASGHRFIKSACVYGRCSDSQHPRHKAFFIALKWAMRDSNPRHPACKAESDGSQHSSGSELTATSSPRCTSRCTENENEPHGDPLAGFVASLTAEQRQRLADLLAGSKEGDAS
jgi:hypothetical protein